MKKFTAICLLLAAIPLAWLFFTSHRTHTGLVLVQTCESAGNTWTTTTKIAGDSARVDALPKVSTIYDLNTGGATVISHPSRTYTKLSLAQMVASTLASLHKEDSPPSAPQPQITDTGKTEPVLGYDARIYTSETPSVKYTCWITKDYPGYAAVNAQFKKYRAMENMSAIFPDLLNIDGLLVKYSITPGGGDTLTITFVSAKIQPIRDSDFRPPADYIELPSPAARQPAAP